MAANSCGRCPGAMSAHSACSAAARLAASSLAPVSAASAAAALQQQRVEQRDNTPAIHVAADWNVPGASAPAEPSFLAC